MEEHVLERARQRIVLEVLNLDPVPTPAPSRATWPRWTAQDKQHVKLRVLSLNAWGLPVAPKCTERVVQMASAISSYELVVLQEIWHIRERNLIISKAQESGFYYYHYFNPAVGFPLPMGADSFGTGLLVLAKFPISSALYHSFSLSGRPYALHELDFVGNKGVGLLRIDTPAGEIDVYVTHLLANYNAGGKPGPGDFYQSHRTGQSYELTQFIAATNRNDLTIVCGDFNSSPDCLELKVPRQLLCLRDAFTDTNDDEDGLTFATPDNKYSHGEHPMRMDYVMYKIDQRTQPSTLHWHVVKSSIFKCFFLDARGEKTPLSDHFGVSAEFVFEERRQPTSKQQEEYEVVTRKDEAENGATIVEPACPSRTCVHCKEQTREPSEEDKAVADAACLHEVLNVLSAGRNQAIVARQARLRRAVTFFVAAVTMLAMHMMSIVVSNWSWVVVLLLSMGSVAEYVLTFFFLTFECSTFTELMNQVQLHLHLQAQRTRERRKQRKTSE